VLAKLDRVFGVLLALASVACFTYVFVQTEPLGFFREHFWSDGVSLESRAAAETTSDFIMGALGILLVLEAARRSIGWIVPGLAIAFMLHAYFARSMPDWALPHTGLNPTQLISCTFLQSLGVLGQAAGVMFQYVFLFVLFGAFLEMSGATQFIIDFSQRMFGNSPGGPAKISVLSSGLMGSLSGSAVANAVTTGAFTIPMMKHSGFKPHVAGGIEAATASGGALVPPVMGAGAYMMLEFIERPEGQPPVTFLEIAKAALIPAILYYFSLFMIVHLHSRKIHARQTREAAPVQGPWFSFEAVVFFGALGSLIALLLFGCSPFRAVTGSLVLILLLSALRPDLKLSRSARVSALVCFSVVVVLHQCSALVDSWMEIQSPLLRNFLPLPWHHPTTGDLELRLVFESLLSSSFIGLLTLLVFGMIHPAWRPEVVGAMRKAAGNGISLVAASACVGIVIGIVQTVNMPQDFAAAIKGVVESNLPLALVGIMVCSLILGMGVPSVVCYLLMATLMGALLSQLGVDPLAAHLFIFYFGMMSMVTPPVALAAYATASIAGAQPLATSWAAFRYSLIGFTLPYMFVYRPELLLMGAEGGKLTAGSIPAVALAVTAAVLGILALAIGLTGFFRTRLPALVRGLAFAAAGLLLLPHLQFAGRDVGLLVNLIGLILLGVVVSWNWLAASQQASA
jgi:TRAP transporter 4TM/12TM fusion protein